MQLEINLI